MIDTRERLRLPSGESAAYYSLPHLERPGWRGGEYELRRPHDYFR
jgi:hypothetical protein